MLLRERFQNYLEHDQPRTSRDVLIAFERNLGYDPAIFSAAYSEKSNVLIGDN